MLVAVNKRLMAYGCGSRQELLGRRASRLGELGILRRPHLGKVTIGILGNTEEGVWCVELEGVERHHILNSTISEETLDNLLVLVVWEVERVHCVEVEGNGILVNICYDRHDSGASKGSVSRVERCKLGAALILVDGEREVKVGVNHLSSSEWKAIESRSRGTCLSTEDEELVLGRWGKARSGIAHSTREILH